jgi:hypothetical protein
MSDRQVMQDWLKEQMADGFAAFAGARVSGTVPVEEGLVNELLAQAVASAASGALSPAPADEAPGGLDVQRLAGMVRHVRVKASPGVVTLEFEVGVDERARPALPPAQA